MICNFICHLQLVKQFSIPFSSITIKTNFPAFSNNATRLLYRESPSSSYIFPFLHKKFRWLVRKPKRFVSATADEKTPLRASVYLSARKFFALYIQFKSKAQPFATFCVISRAMITASARDAKRHSGFIHVVEAFAFVIWGTWTHANKAWPLNYRDI